MKLLSIPYRHKERQAYVWNSKASMTSLLKKLFLPINDLLCSKKSFADSNLKMKVEKRVLGKIQRYRHLK